MKVYKLTTEKEIKEMLNQALKIEDAKDYASRLAGFFFQKVKDAINVMVTKERWGEAFPYGEQESTKFIHKYGCEVDAYVIKETLNDYETADDHYRALDSIVERIVKEELKNPLSVEVEYLEDEEDIANASMELDGEFWNKYSEEIMPSKVCDLYNRSFGTDKWFDEELSEFIQHYDLAL